MSTGAVAQSKRLYRAGAYVQGGEEIASAGTGPLVCRMLRIPFRRCVLRPGGYAAGVDSDLQPRTPQSPLFPNWLRLVLLCVGVGAVVWLVQSVGPEAVWQTLLMAGPWLPLIFLCELTWIVIEGFGLLVLLGRWRRQISLKAWVLATLAHATTMMVLPVGRAGAEALRATMLSRHVGGGRAAAASSLMQSLVLIGNTLMSALCAVVVLVRGGGGDLALVLTVNALATAVLGGGLYTLLRRGKVGGFLGKHFEKMAHFGPELDEHVQENLPRHWLAFVFVISGRTLQTLQYGVILAAVAGSFDFLGMFVAQGIHLVGAGLGDMVPNQVGVTEGAFRYFAPALGLADHPERAVSLALLARTSTLTVAGLCAAAVQLVAGRMPQPQAELGPSPSLQDTAAGS